MGEANLRRADVIHSGRLPVPNWRLRLKPATELAVERKQAEGTLRLDCARGASLTTCVETLHA